MKGKFSPCAFVNGYYLESRQGVTVIFGGRPHSPLCNAINRLLRCFVEITFQVETHHVMDTAAAAHSSSAIPLHSGLTIEMTTISLIRNLKTLQVAQSPAVGSYNNKHYQPSVRW